MKLTRRQLLNLLPSLIAARWVRHIKATAPPDETQIPMSVPTAVGQEVRYYAFLPIGKRGKGEIN